MTFIKVFKPNLFEIRTHLCLGQNLGKFYNFVRNHKILCFLILVKYFLVMGYILIIVVMEFFFVNRDIFIFINSVELFMFYDYLRGVVLEEYQEFVFGLVQFKIITINFSFLDCFLLGYFYYYYFFHL